MHDQLRPVPIDVIRQSEIETPQKRLSALLTVAQNGSRALTILCGMKPNPDVWDTYSNINTEMNTRLGYTPKDRLVHTAVTRDAFVDTLVKTGVVKANGDNTQFALEPLGIAIRAPLIYAWQRFRFLGLDESEALGSDYQAIKDEYGNMRTSADVRIAIFETLFNHGKLSIYELRGKMHVSRDSLNHHINELEKAELLKREGPSAEGGPITVCRLTLKGKATQEWPVFVRKERSGRTYARVNYSSYAKEAVFALSAQGKIVTIRAVEDFAMNAHNLQQRPSNMGSILKMFAQEDLIDYVKFHGRDISEVSLPRFGNAVWEQILSRLKQWSANSASIPEINDIEKTLAANPHAYDALYRQIAASFREFSSRKGEQKDDQRAQVLAIIQRHSGNIHTAEVARETALPRDLTTSIIRSLTAEGRVQKHTAPVGNRMLLTYVETPQTLGDSSLSGTVLD